MSVGDDICSSFRQYFRYVEEICWAIECLKKTKKPVVAMMNIGGMGDRIGISTADCALKMAEAGTLLLSVFIVLVSSCCFLAEVNLILNYVLIIWYPF